MTPRLFDSLMFRDGLDMLEVRLREMESCDLTHIVIEAKVTHRGDPKPLVYADNRERFAAWSDRIIHVVADLPENPNPWVLEHIQRSHVWAALDDAGAKNDDVVFLADVDEFVPAEAFTVMPEPVLAHEQRLCMYSVDLEHPTESPTRCSVSCRVGYGRGKDATAIRDSRWNWPAVRGGWHLTWLGGIEKQREKLLATCHTEMRQDEYDRIWSGACYEQGIHHGTGQPMLRVDVDETWPKMIYERRVPESWFRPRP